MIVKDSCVNVRMYRQGHGDCFLLAFPKKNGDACYVLIDCGYKPGSNDAKKYGLHPITDIVDNIKKSTGGRLDLVVITHEHQDHVNGFWKETDPYFGNFKIGAAWFAWTEDPNDKLANDLRKRYHDQLLGLVGARNQLAAAGGPQAAERIDELLSLELGVDEPREFAAAAEKKRKDPEGSINKQGMKLVKDHAGKKNTKYIRPHKEILRLPDVDDIRVFAFGPPHNADLIILPQVQSIRDVLDHDSYCMVVKERELRDALDMLKRPPALVVTDSQAFLRVAGDTPPEVPLTSFSILFARLKGDLKEFVRGVKAVYKLKSGDRVLVLEACAHHPIGEDIGRVKIPRWVRQYTGMELDFVHMQGHDFPQDLSSYQIVIHCGSCMLNRREVISRIMRCREAGVPVTNYGVAITAA
jgi:hypothetical protein